MHTPRNLTTVVLMTAFAAAAAHAAVIATEDFEAYAAQPTTSTQQFAIDVAGDQGSGWSADWAADPGAENDSVSPTLGPFVVEGGLNYSGGAITMHGGGRRLQYRHTSAASDNLLSREFPSQSGPVYLGFVYRGSGLEDDFVQLSLSTNGVVGGLGDSGAVASALLPRGGNVQVRAGSADGTDSIPVSTVDVADYADGTTYLVVLKLWKDGAATYNRASLFLDPTSLTEGDHASVTASVDTGVSAVSYLKLRQSAVDSFNEINVDQVRIATTFAEAVLPEPATMGLLAIGLPVFLRRRGRG